MPTISSASRDELAREASELTRADDAAVRELYARHARALHGYVRRFCPDRASADDIVQETFIRAWRHLPQLSADDRLVRAWLYRVARNLLTDAARARRSRPVTVRVQPAEEGGDDTKLSQVLDQQLVTGALRQLSASHRTVLVETLFGYPGLSSLLATAVTARDYPEVQGIVLVMSVLFIALKLSADLLYGALDPRARIA